MKIIEEQKTKYEKNFIKNGPSPSGLFWNNRETQEHRFAMLLNNLDLKNKFSIHDVGAGIADLHKYLNKNKINHIYSGTEIVPEMVKYINQVYPTIKIFERNILNAEDIEKYDYLVLSGTLNLKTGTAQEWKKFTFELLKKMFSMSKIAISFNFLTTYKNKTDENLCYFDPKEMLDFCIKNLSRFVSINHFSPLYETTITVFTQEYMKKKYKNSTYDKYF